MSADDDPLIDHCRRFLALAQDHALSGGFSAGHFAHPDHEGELAGWLTPYPEVTGYLLPTLLRAGFDQRAEAAVRWLVRIQDPASGGIPGYLWRGRPAVFDTGMVLSGWQAMRAAGREGLERPIAEAVGFLESADLSGAEPYWVRCAAPLKREGSSAWTEYVDLALRELDSDDWPEHTVQKYDPTPLSHFLCYTVRGLIDCEIPAGIRMAERLREVQRADGSIPARVGPGWQPKAAWTCVPAVAQAGIIFARCGWKEPAERAMSYLRSLGGPFWASDPRDAEYLPYTAPLWNYKFILDLHYELGMLEDGDG